MRRLAAAPSPSSPPSSPSSSQEAADEEIVRSSWLTDPPASPRSAPASSPPSSPESVEEQVVRASWLMDPPEPSPMPTASEAVRAVPAAVLASPPTFDARCAAIRARDAAADAHVAIGPRWADLTPPGTAAAALGEHARPSNLQRLLQVPRLRLSTILRLPKLPLRRRSAGVSRLLEAFSEA